MDNLKNTLTKWSRKIETNIYMKSISSAMMGIMPIMMISSVAALIAAIDIGSSQQFMASIGLLTLVNQVNAMTINIVSVYIAFLVAYRLAQNLEEDSLIAGLIGVMSFMILTPLLEDGNIATSTLGSGGMFVAIFGSLLGAKLYIFFIKKKLVINMPSSVPPVVSKSFAAIIPGVLVAAILGAIYSLIVHLGLISLESIIYTIIQKPLTIVGANIFACMLIVAFIELLWFFGIHGVMAVYPIVMLVFYEPQLANLEAFTAGNPLPYLFTMGFLLNNRGARSLAVSILCIFKCKSERLKAVGKLGFIPACFGISEPIKFGIPQVLNLRMLIPLMLTPAVSILSAYILTIIGFLPYQNGVALPTGFPVIFNGLLTNGWQGVVAQIIQLILCVLIYIPFMKSQDNEYYKEELEYAKANESVATTV